MFSKLRKAFLKKGSFRLIYNSFLSLTLGREMLEVCHFFHLLRCQGIRKFESNSYKTKKVLKSTFHSSVVDFEYGQDKITEMD